MDNKIEIFKIADQETRIEVHFDQDTIWLTQQQMASLFEQTKQNISLHINNCFKEEELYPDSVVKESLATATDGKKYRTKYYNLDVIISVGYRVKSKRGTQFRQWATSRLKEYLVDGYAINQKRLEERNLELQHLKTGIAILRRAISHQAQNLDDAENFAGLTDALICRAAHLSSMPKAIRHYIPGDAWYITPRCHEDELTHYIGIRHEREKI